MSNLIAVLNTKAFKTTGQASAPANNVVIINSHQPSIILNFDEDEVYDGTFIRKFTFDLCVFESVADYQTFGSTYILGEFVDFNVGYEKILTQQDFDDFEADGSLLYTWVQEMLDAIAGNTATLVDPLA
jgi:hypothetical protein